MSRSDAEFEANIVANVEQHGCSINAVFDPEESQPDFAYSIGFPKSVHQPEVIVFGLSLDLMKFMINEMFRQCKDKGLVMEDGLRVRGLLEGHECELREVPKASIDTEHFNSAIWYRRTVMGEIMDRAFQIFWPGAADGLLPWDVAADPYVVGLQSELLKDMRT